MADNDPNLPLNCPNRGDRLRYLATTTSVPEAKLAVRSPRAPIAEVHHFLCVKCGAAWKLDPTQSGLEHEPA